MQTEYGMNASQPTQQPNSHATQSSQLNLTQLKPNQTKQQIKEKKEKNKNRKIRQSSHQIRKGK